MKIVHMLALLLTVVGALNWGLVGLLDFNIVKALFGAYPAVERIIYILVGLSAIVLLLTHTKYMPALHHDRHDRR